MLGIETKIFCMQLVYGRKLEWSEAAGEKIRMRIAAAWLVLVVLNSDPEIWSYVPEYAPERTLP